MPRIEMNVCPVCVLPVTVVDDGAYYGVDMTDSTECAPLCLSTWSATRHKL